MSNILDIANGVASKLAEYNAGVVFAPVIELDKGQVMRIEVLPVGKGRKFLTRSSYESVDSVNIGIIHKCREEGAIPELINLVETIGEGLLGTKVGTSICIGAKWEPLFAVDELRSKGLFVSVIEASFKEMS